VAPVLFASHCQLAASSVQCSATLAWFCSALDILSGTTPAMNNLAPFLWFNDDAEEAAEFYLSRIRRPIVAIAYDNLPSMRPEMYKDIERDIKRRKTSRGRELLKESQQRGSNKPEYL